MNKETAGENPKDYYYYYYYYKLQFITTVYKSHQFDILNIIMIIVLNLLNYSYCIYRLFNGVFKICI